MSSDPFANPPILEYASPALTHWRGEYAAWWWARVFYALGGILIPVFCWGASFTDVAPKPDWQTGQVTAYTTFLLHGTVAYPLFPFMLYPVVCLALLLIRREFFARSLWVRLGIYTALPQAVAFGFILAGGDTWPGSVFAVMLVATGLTVALGGAAIGFWWLTRGLGWRVPLILAGGVVLILSMLGLYDAVGVGDPLQGLEAALGTTGLFALGAGPAAALLAFAVMTFYLFRHRREYQPRRLTAAIFWPVWTGAYAAAAAAATVRALEEYSKLPASPPHHCYIASAAARGHPGFVDSAPLSADPAVRVNDQLRTLKAFEILLQVLAPRFHRHLRRVYNTFGPPLAARLTHPLLADAAYVFLKPVELLARAVLHVFGLRGLAARLYRTQARAPNPPA